MEKLTQLEKDEEYSPTDLKFFQTPKFNLPVAKGFGEESPLKSFSSQESKNFSTNRTSSNFSDHFNTYKSAFKPASIEKVEEEDERVATSNCKCKLF